MREPKLNQRNELVNCLLGDNSELRNQITILREPGADFEHKRAMMAAFFPWITVHVNAEEEVLLARALEIEETRISAMLALEEHEIAEVVADRVKHSANGDQLAARLRLLCDLLEFHMSRKERELYPLIRACLTVEEREEMGRRYLEAKERSELAPLFQMVPRTSLLESQAGRVGYIIAWLLGVPVWILLLIFLIRGH